MKPITALSAEARHNIKYVLADIDDTITTRGKLPASSYSAMWRLHDAGIHVIPVTGRPAGWCDLICRQWPVSGVVGENGAFAFHMDGDNLKEMCHPEAPEPTANRTRLDLIARQVYRDVPGTRPAKDQFSRLYDVAIDFREEPPYLDLDSARRIRDIFEAAGAHAKISSIHVNAWFGDYDKRSMASLFLLRKFTLDTEDPDQNRAVAYCGDSPNDAPLFAAFENSIAVANIEQFVDDIEHQPNYVTNGHSAEGFHEFVDLLLE